MKFLLGSLILSSGLFLTAQAQPSNNQVTAMVEALRLAAPKTGTVNDGLYSEWQVKPETLQSWSKYCLKKQVSPTQFENNPQLARQVVSCVVERELKGQLQTTNNDQAVSRTACWWMTGKYEGCNSGFVADYVKKVRGYYQQSLKKPASSN